MRQRTKCEGEREGEWTAKIQRILGETGGAHSPSRRVLPRPSAGHSPLYNSLQSSHFLVLLSNRVWVGSSGARTPKLPGPQVYRSMYRSQRHIKRQMERHNERFCSRTFCQHLVSLNGLSWSAHAVGHIFLSCPFACCGKLNVEALSPLSTLGLGFLLWAQVWTR